MSLPIDLQLEIFSYLPCKLIVRFMVLSHLHNSLLISPDFIFRHHSKSRNKLFVLLSSSITCLCEDDDHLTLFQNLFVHRKFGTNIIGICNGIICMHNYCDIFFINPTIRYCFNLPLHEDKSSKYIYGYAYGFISRGLSDYLVVKIDLDAKNFYYIDRDDDDDNYGGYIPSPRKAWVYTYLENDWRPLEIPPDWSICTTTMNIAYNGVVSYGLLHWGAKRCVEDAWYHFILTFDPQTEVFGELLLADSLAAAIYSYSEDNRVIVVQNSIKPLTLYSLIFSEENYCTAAVWVMDRYGMTESWNQIFTFNHAHNYISSNLFGFNPDIHSYIKLPFLLFHKSDGKLLFDLELIIPYLEREYSICSLDINHISHETVLIRNNINKFDFDHLYIGYSSPSLFLLDKVSASSNASVMVIDTSLSIRRQKAVD